MSKKPSRKELELRIQELEKTALEHKKVQNALKEEKVKFIAVLDATPFPIAVVDLQDDQINYWSRSAHDLFGHTAPTAPEWYQIAYPDPDYRQEVINRWKPFLKEAREFGDSVNTGEYQVTCQDGSVRICELFAAFIPDHLIVTFNDVTDRKNAEKKILELNRDLELRVKQRTDELNSSNRELKRSLKEVKTLRGVIPICSYCHSIRSDEGAWRQLEEYISQNSNAKFSHGICPKCLPKVKQEIKDMKSKKT